MVGWMVYSIVENLERWPKHSKFGLGFMVTYSGLAGMKRLVGTILADINLGLAGRNDPG